jgi:hypothetical protein
MSEENVKNEGMDVKEVSRMRLSVENIAMGYQDKPVFMFSVYSEDGGYVGTVESALQYFKRGIIPELSRPDNKVCSIGKSVFDGKWYGWSHRAIYGFSVGDTVKDGDLCAESGFTEEYLKEHPNEDRSLPVGFVAKTEDDARKMAIAFADSVA